jgi:hypothetical protein
MLTYNDTGVCWRLSNGEGTGRMAIKRCVVCNGKFVARANAKTCSSKCSKKRACEHVRRWRTNNPEKSRESERKSNAMRRLKPKSPTFKRCVVCGSKFRALRSTKTCSPKHSIMFASETKRIYRLNNREKRSHQNTVYRANLRAEAKAFRALQNLAGVSRD